MKVDTLYLSEILNKTVIFYIFNTLAQIVNKFNYYIIIIKWLNQWKNYYKICIMIGNCGVKKE